MTNTDKTAARHTPELDSSLAYICEARATLIAGGRPLHFSLDMLDGARAELRILKDSHAALIEALEKILIDLGKKGANADTQHVGRNAWEVARAALTAAKGE